MTADDIRRVTFEEVKKGGYNRDHVDGYLQDVAAEMEALNSRSGNASQMQAELDAARADAAAARAEAEQAKVDAENKLVVLAQRVEEYREQEDTIKTALLNAQRMGETVIKEAKAKAETLVGEASKQAELIRKNSDGEIEEQRLLLEHLRNEVTKFRSTVLTLYKQHIEAMSALDTPIAQADNTLEKYTTEVEEPATEEVVEEASVEEVVEVVEEEAAEEEVAEEVAATEEAAEEAPALDLFAGE